MGCEPGFPAGMVGLAPWRATRARKSLARHQRRAEPSPVMPPGEVANDGVADLSFPALRMQSRIAGARESRIQPSILMPRLTGRFSDDGSGITTGFRRCKAFLY